MEPKPRFFWVVGLGVLAGCCAYAALVLNSATWAEARALDRIFPFYAWRIRPFTVAAYEDLRRGLGLAALAMGLAAAGLGWAGRTRAELAALGREIRQGWRELAAGPRALTTRQRALVLGGLAVLTAVRLYFSIDNPEYDDAVSYEVFVSKGWLATSAYYPIPNNHVFSNAISLLFYQVSPGFWWSMRLPVLLLSTGATAYLFAALRLRAGFAVAALATGLFSWLQLSLYHAGVGRGYWLAIGLAGVVFFSTLRLAEAPAGRNRAAWLGVLGASVLGGYTVPPFVYVVASSFSWLLLAFVGQRRWAHLGQAVAVGAVAGGAVAALYAPLLLVSGLNQLVGNGYVAALPAGAFWAGLPAYIWHNEGFLAGQRTLGALITLPVLGLLAGLFHRARAGRLPADQTARLHRVGRPALWFVAFPYVLIGVQRVFPPERVLLYKAFFFFILLGLVAQWVLTREPAPAGRWAHRALVAFVVLFCGYETYSVVRVNPAARHSNAAYRAGLYWLAAQPAGPVLVPEPTHNLFFRFYAHSELRQRPWRIDNDQQANTRYAYVVAFPNRRGFFQPQFTFPPTYQNQEVEIYRVPANYPLHTAAWRH